MPVDYFPQKSVEELLALLGQAQERLLKGAVVATSAAGISMARQPAAGGGSEVSRQILRLRYSLHLRAADTADADVYPNPYAERIRRTLPAYRC